MSELTVDGMFGVADMHGTVMARNAGNRGGADVFLDTDSNSHSPGK
ncbi:MULTISPECIES: hypothetical protein [Burkholderia]|uniref:Uncharacterized protein n=1 Tax=Burkholderia seminalis TaxID=488731 RepID=A0A8A8D473_9BURK|nr:MULTISPECIES: hypothetical protein [Burkholderia]MBN3738199.1 hypothetical protein [Burkholderia sp. Tr-20355]MCA8041627.1 hypothetical protein [Burkholderia seminalis]MCA8301443.1 hypothetical protein [Burkholderia seminalis]MCA8431744.1 hypothetical protein [Burkholderia seminalis]QTO19482.1 hypothetical protein DT99_004350 [Burkholderia seminalis]